MHWDFVLILLVLGVVVPAMGRRRMRHLIEMPSTTRLERLTLYASTIAFQWVATCVILWRAAAFGVHPAQLGFAVPRPELAWTLTVLVSLLILANQIFSLRRISSHPNERRGLISHLALKVFPQDAVERLSFMALVTTVALCEELIYRGFVQYIFQILGGVLFGIVASALFFGLAHLYQDRRGTASTFVVGLLFSGIRAWTGSLIPGIVAHFLADLIIGFSAPECVRNALKDFEMQSNREVELSDRNNLST